MSASQGRDASQSIDPGGERQQRVLGQFHSFPFSSDGAFQQGLSEVLAYQSMNQISDSEKSELILKMKVFYFNRVTGHNICLEDVQPGYAVGLNCFPIQSGNECSQTSGAEHGEKIRVLTFAELKRLIEEGSTDNIPNNKTIPDTLNDDVPSKSTAPLRRKPWELATQS